MPKQEQATPDALGIFLREMTRRDKRFTREQERELCLKSQAGDLAARDALVDSVLPLAVKLARKTVERFPRERIDLEDAICVASGCVLNCIRCLNPDKGRLTTFVTTSVPRAVRKQMFDHGFQVRLPSHRWREIDAIREHSAKFTASLNADDLYQGDHHAVENSLLSSAERSHRVEHVELADARDSERELRRRLSAAIESLPERMQFILDQRIWHGKKLAAIGREANLSRERTRQLLESALAMLREELGNDCDALLQLAAEARPT